MNILTLQSVINLSIHVSKLFEMETTFMIINVWTYTDIYRFIFIIYIYPINVFWRFSHVMVSPVKFKLVDQSRLMVDIQPEVIPFCSLIILTQLSNMTAGEREKMIRPSISSSLICIMLGYMYSPGITLYVTSWLR